MSEGSNQAKEQAMLSTEFTCEICDRASTHHRQETEFKPSENKSRHFPDNGDLVVQFIHFNQNKDGCLE